MMKSHNYHRTTTISLHRRGRSRRKSGVRFFLKLFLFLFVLVGLVVGGCWGVVKGYHALRQARLSDWHARKIVVSGVTGDLLKALTALATPYQDKPFSIKEAVALRDKVRTTYPMLKEVSVKRGLLSGKLTLSAKHRTPLAKFVRPDDIVRYIDADSTIYADPHPALLTAIPTVELSGEVPEKLNSEFIDLVESTLKLNKDLNFVLLRMNLTDNTVQMHLPDGDEINFGQAVNLKKKTARAAQIMALARGKYPSPFTLDFRFFEEGKVFLAQKAH